MSHNDSWFVGFVTFVRSRFCLFVSLRKVCFVSVCVASCAVCVVLCLVGSLACLCLVCCVFVSVCVFMFDLRRSDPKWRCPQLQIFMVVDLGSVVGHRDATFEG